MGRTTEMQSRADALAERHARTFMPKQAPRCSQVEAEDGARYGDTNAYFYEEPV